MQSRPFWNLKSEIRVAAEGSAVQRVKDLDRGQKPFIIRAPGKMTARAQVRGAASGGCAWGDCHISHDGRE